MNLVDDLEKCCGCGACECICPINCISLKMDWEGFYYPEIDMIKCVDCHSCEKVCPMINTGIAKSGGTACYAVMNKDEHIRTKSSSGGFFSVLAEYVISCGGVVFGAKFNDSFQVVHGYAETIDNCTAFVGSKYLQSHMNKVFVDVKGFLEKGRMVLFSGTGCQVYALRNFLKHDFENLICADVACHGVTSERLLISYQGYLRRKFHTNISHINFRDKSSGWKGYSVRVDFENGHTYIKEAEKDFFMRAYRSGNYLRPSCYQCKFRGLDRIADFTLADFWGIDRLMPEMDDDKGTSLVFIHSEKAKRIFAEVSEKILIKAANVEKVIKGNPSITSDVAKTLKRSEFIEEINENPINKVVKKYCKRPITIYELKVKVAKIIKAGRR